MATNTRKIAHLSDVHVLGTRARAALDLGTRFVSFGRKLDATERAAKLGRALAAAKAGGAGHFVLSGDLTETGTPEQFEALGELLHDARIDPDRVVLVPGNHDTYAAPDAWARALAGPLSAFRRGAASEHGKVVERDGATFFPLDVACHQHVTRSAGELSNDAADALERRLADPGTHGERRVVVLHHSPFPHASRAWQWIDGLRGAERLVSILARFPDVLVLHGHLHYAVARSVGPGGDRVFGATAVVDDKATPRVGFHDGPAEARPAARRHPPLAA
jgi:Icc protein